MRVDVIGAGRIGQALQARAEANGVDGRLVRRDGDWDALADAPGRPALVCTRNDDLPTVIDAVPASRRADLVFVQNGMLRPSLASWGLADATRGLLFLAVQRRGDDATPGEPSPFHGRHDDAVVAWMTALGLPARSTDSEGFAALELEKLLWNCVFGVLCDARDADVGTIVREHRALVTALVTELLPVGERALGVRLDVTPLVDRLCAYSLSIQDFRAGVREWPWRNGWFAAQGVALPLHDALLSEAGFHSPR